MTIPVRQIRAVYDADTIRVYQAYNDAIADSALAHGTFLHLAAVQKNAHDLDKALLPLDDVPQWLGAERR